jgi:hypothetical protein
MYYIHSLGYAVGFPSTNNALEVTNNVIKNETTFRERLSMGRFLVVVEDKIIRKWSTLRDPTKLNYRLFKQEIEISPKLWQLVYSLCLEKREVVNITRNYVCEHNYKESSEA